TRRRPAVAAARRRNPARGGMGVPASLRGRGPAPPPLSLAALWVRPGVLCRQQCPERQMDAYVLPTRRREEEPGPRAGWHRWPRRPGGRPPSSHDRAVLAAVVLVVGEVPDHVVLGVAGDQLPGLGVDEPAAVRASPARPRGCPAPGG